MTPPVVQFVCFTTPLPPLIFTPAWVPFASTFLAQGLQQIVLAERIGHHRGVGPSFNFISRNLWPEEAFAHAFQAGHIGDGAGGPVRAEQGGTFQATETLPGPEQHDREKVVALLKVSSQDTAVLGTALEDAFTTLSDVRVSIYRKSATGRRQRFDIVAELNGTRGQGEYLAIRLEEVITGAVDGTQSSVDIYREILTLPPLHTS